jgi:hypothetical protein
MILRIGQWLSMIVMFIALNGYFYDRLQPNAASMSQIYAKKMGGAGT